jgi:hypothetical protein
VTYVVEVAPFNEIRIKWTSLVSISLTKSLSLVLGLESSNLNIGLLDDHFFLFES